MGFRVCQNCGGKGGGGGLVSCPFVISDLS